MTATELEPDDGSARNERQDEVRDALADQRRRRDQQRSAAGEENGEAKSGLRCVDNRTRERRKRVTALAAKGRSDVGSHERHRGARHKQHNDAVEGRAEPAVQIEERRRVAEKHEKACKARQSADASDHDSGGLIEDQRLVATPLRNQNRHVAFGRAIETKIAHSDERGRRRDDQPLAV
ncbi:MAG: hypothetical protein ACLPGW_04635 [Roseiarcus sp.]